MLFERNREVFADCKSCFVKIVDFIFRSGFCCCELHMRKFPYECWVFLARNKVRGRRKTFFKPFSVKKLGQTEIRPISLSYAYKMTSALNFNIFCFRSQGVDFIMVFVLIGIIVDWLQHKWLLVQGKSFSICFVVSYVHFMKNVKIFWKTILDPFQTFLPISFADNTHIYFFRKLAGLGTMCTIVGFRHLWWFWDGNLLFDLIFRKKCPYARVVLVWY